MNGAALIRSAEAFRVVPSDQATGFRMQQGFGVHIIPLQYAAAAAVRSAIEPFVPPGRTVRIDAARNLLIFTGTGAEARDLEKLIEVFDVDWMTGMSFAIFTLQTAEAKRLTQELEQVFGESFDGPLSEIVQFVPIERLNSILVITPQAAYLDKAAAWIERLDRGEEGVDQRIYVYLVQNGRAKDIAAVLDEVFGAGRANGGLLDAGALAPGLAPIELTDYPRSPTPELRNSTERAAAAAAEDADGASADEIAAEPAVVSATEGAVGEGIAVGAEEGIRIVADERNNALVIRATPAQFRMVQAALRQLDLVPLQVLIEATIAEVTLNDQLKYGLQWFFVNGDFTLSFSEAAALIPAAVVPGFQLPVHADRCARGSQRTDNDHGRAGHILAPAHGPGQRDSPPPGRRPGPDRDAIGRLGHRSGCTDRQCHRVSRYWCHPGHNPACQCERPGGHRHHPGGEQRGRDRNLRYRFADHSAEADRKQRRRADGRDDSPGRPHPRRQDKLGDRNPCAFGYPHPRQSLQDHGRQDAADRAAGASDAASGPGHPGRARCDRGAAPASALADAPRVEHPRAGDSTAAATPKEPTTAGGDATCAAGGRSRRFNDRANDHETHARAVGNSTRASREWPWL